MRQLRTSYKWFDFTIIVVLAIFYACLAGSSVLAQGSLLTLISVQPDQVANDVDTPIEISGDGFLNESGNPQVFLDETQLTQVSWIDGNTLVAQVPWGLKTGSYTLKVVNPDGAEAILSTKFEVTQGIGQWNTNAIDGGPVQVVLPVAPVPGLVYAYSWTTSAIYRSVDSGENWITVGHAGGQYLTYDPSQPDTLFLNQLKSSDGGATWHDMLPDGIWPGTDRYPGYNTLAFPDPAHAGTIFLATADIPVGSGELSGLLRSVDYGQTWTAVETGLNGDTNVTAMEFAGATIYLGTRDGSIFQSGDGGDTWLKIGDLILESIGVLEINPSGDELWATTHFLVSANAQMARLDLTSPSHTVTLVPSWPADQYPKNLGFLEDDRVFVGTQWDEGWITVNGGIDWKQFRPSTGKPGYCLALDPWDSSKRTFYIADEQYGVQKTTDMFVTGATVTANWQKMNTGLHAMSPDAIAVDPNNPSLVYQTVGNGWPGIFVSADGGQSWNFSSIQSALGLEKAEWDTVRPITSTLAVSGGRVFVGFHGNDNWGYGPQLMLSDDQGKTWHRVNVDPNPRSLYSTSFHMPWTLKVDPNNPNIMLLSAVIGNRDLTPDQFVSEIYRSTDQGESWQRVNLFDQLHYEVNNLLDLEFDPHDPNIVYASNSHNIFKSSDNGLTWNLLLHVDTYPIGGQIAVEPVPPYRLYVGRLVSPDGGASWSPTFDMPVSPDQIMFVPGTDTVYIAGGGLAVSYNGGTTWQSVPGIMAKTKITSLEVSRKDQRVILYLGTPGGEAQKDVSASIRSAPVYSASLDAGVYRLTEVRINIFIPLVVRP